MSSEVMEAEVFTFNSLLQVTLVDRLAKEASERPVRDKTARSIEQAFRRCFAVIEPLRTLILDRGREYIE